MSIYNINQFTTYTACMTRKTLEFSKSTKPKGKEIKINQSY